MLAHRNRGASDLAEAAEHAARSAAPAVALVDRPRRYGGAALVADAWRGPKRIEVATIVRERSL
jgi:hypothetical protein